jgi:hypothetical protein
MRSIEAQRAPLRATTAASMVAAIFLLLLMPDFALDQFRLWDSLSTVGAYAVFLPWLVFPGLAALIAVRSSSETAVTAVAVLLPSLWTASQVAGPPLDLLDIGLPFAVAGGVAVGVWVGTDVLRRGGRGRTAAGMVAAALAALVVGVLMAIPALAQPGFMDPMPRELL